MVVQSMQHAHSLAVWGRSLTRAVSARALLHTHTHTHLTPYIPRFFRKARCSCLPCRDAPLGHSAFFYAVLERIECVLFETAFLCWSFQQTRRCTVEEI
jgi:hypothetical protein